MLPLQYASLWRVLSAVLLLLVLAAALAPTWWFDTKAEALSWFEHADKWLHGIIFLGLTLWFSGLIARRAWVGMAFGLLLFGALIEACQLLVSYRMADRIDLAADALGILLGMAIAAAGLGGWGLRLEDWYTRRTAI
jgi:VanZ family protein